MLVGTLSSSSIIFSDSFPCSSPALAMVLVFSNCVLFSGQRLIAVNIDMFDDIDGSLGTLSNKSVSTTTRPPTVFWTCCNSASDGVSFIMSFSQTMRRSNRTLYLWRRSWRYTRSVFGKWLFISKFNMKML